MFEKICEDGLYDRDQSQWTDCSHYSDPLLFLNCLTERSYAALSMKHASSKPYKRRIWVMHPTDSSPKMCERQVLLLVNHDSQGIAAMDEVYAIAELISEGEPRGSRQSYLPSYLSTAFFQYDRPLLFSLSIQQSFTINFVRCDRYGFMATQFEIHRHPWTVLGCISSLATCESYHLGLSHRLELTSIPTGKVSSKSIETIIYQKATHPRQSADRRIHVRLTGPPTFGPFDKSLFPCNCPLQWKFVENCDCPPEDHAEFVDELKDVEGVPKIAAYRSTTVDSMIVDKRHRGPRSQIVESVIQTAEDFIAISWFSSRKEFFLAMISCLESG